MAADPTSRVPIGTVLVGKYRITREIGKGGMAVVYEAENVDIGKRVAVKSTSGRTHYFTGRQRALSTRGSSCGRRAQPIYL